MNRGSSGYSKLKELEREYQSIYSLSFKFSDELKKQLNELMIQYEISLAFPIDSRVKEWGSLARKLKESSLFPDSIKQMNDLIGFRIILLFRSDLYNVYKILEHNFKIIDKEDTQKRLRESEFGYLSVHYIIELPESWFAIPTFSSLHGFRAEVQLRTAAQHIWAAASHKLQYKQEDAVPFPLRRSIHRVSALLETVDIELDRVIDKRAEYIEQFNRIKEDKILNVDLLKHILDDKLPKNNYDIDDDYAVILKELLGYGIDTSSKLISLLGKHLNSSLDEDARIVNDIRADPDAALSYTVDDWERIRKGVYFSFTGLIRIALGLEFGETIIIES